MFQNILKWGAHETGTLLADDIMENFTSLQKPPVVKPSLSLQPHPLKPLQFIKRTN